MPRDLSGTAAQASRGLSATAELLVLLHVTFGCCSIHKRTMLYLLNRNFSAYILHASC